MQTPIDLVARHQQELAEQATQGERARVANVQRFTQMWLTLGADCIRAAGSGHQDELTEALGLATHRWSRLLDMEAQVQRDEQQLATRGKKRPPAHDEQLLPDRTVAQRDRAYLDETAHRRAALSELKAQAKHERADLESFVIKSKGR
jgi:hypothetical protein